MLAGVAVAVLGGFFVVVAPLFNAGGAPTAELAGAIPQHAPADATLEIDTGLDNTGTSLLNPVCVRASVSGPLILDRAVFQGLDSIPFHNGSACGGSLGGQETVSVKLYLRPTGTGTAEVSFTPAQGATTLGGPLAGTITIENR